MARKAPGRPAKNVEAQIEQEEPKVVEAKVEAPKLENKRVPRIPRQKKLHEVIVRGRTRAVTEAAYKLLAKDPQLEVVLPEGSELVEPSPTPCKDC
jgi:hypothetical protein